MEKRIPHPTAGIERWVACVIYQQDNHYTTPTTDSVSKIKYLCIRAYYWRLALSKVVTVFNDALQDTALKTPILILGILTDPKTY